MSFRAEILILVLICPAALMSAELKPVTLKAWNEYVQAAESRMQNNEARGISWLEDDTGRRQRLRGGEILAAPLDGKPSRAVPHGVIHDWVGAVFVPGASLDDVLAVIQNYDEYAKYYGPAIRTSKLLSRDNGVWLFRLQYVQKAVFVTVALDVRYKARFRRIDSRHGYSIAQSTSIRQIQNYGEPDECELPADQGSGYLWRAASLLQFNADDGGVYVERENMALSRGVPVELRWIVDPFVQRLSKELMTGWLARTRSAVVAAQSHAPAGA